MDKNNKPEISEEDRESLEKDISMEEILVAIKKQKKKKSTIKMPQGQMSSQHNIINYYRRRSFNHLRIWWMKSEKRDMYWTPGRRPP